MRQALPAIVGALALLPCSACTNSQAANAIIATAATVAATVALRAVTGSCYASCAYGTVCNQQTGFCEPEPGGKTVCVDVPGEPPCSPRPPAPSEAGASAADDDPCAGMCYENEVCVMHHGDLSCELATTPRHKAPESAE